jgi:hypothetical protein
MHLKRGTTRTQTHPCGSFTNGFKTSEEVFAK